MDPPPAPLLSDDIVLEKSGRVLELERRVEQDKYDTEAWLELLRRAGTLAQVGSGTGVLSPAVLDTVYSTYEAFLAVFPSSVRGARGW